MPLFVGKIIVQMMVDIPIVAADEREAVEYLNSTDEWKSDSGFEGFNGGDMSVGGVEMVLTPLQTPADWDGDTLCWNGDDTKIGQAFFDEQLKRLEPKCDEMSDEECDKEWSTFFDEEQKLCDQFDTARKM